ncbi:winged helix-turn-helix domain-containing protein [Bifidobacterium bohemicum]
MRILGALKVNDPQTVGSISKQLDLPPPPGPISYHLQQLPMMRLVEKMHPTDVDKRESWWRAYQPATHIDEDTSETPEERFDEGDLFRRSAALPYEQAYERYLDNMEAVAEEWVEAGTSSDHILRLTASQTRQTGSDINNMIE